MRKRQRKKWLKQHGLYVNPKETWNLDITLAKHIIPRLKKFKEASITYPGRDEMDTPEKWNEALDKMIQAFKYINDKDEYMGTNFYLITQSKEIRNKFFTDSDYELTDEPIWGYEVHIAKTSLGWKTLWEDHSFYHSVEELRKFCKKHKTYIYIYDEYNKFYTWEDFEKRVINWGNEQPVRYMKYLPEGKYNEIFGGRDYLIESTEDDYDIKMPYDHVRYHELDPYNEKRWMDKRREPMYFHDNDGYDFTKGRFS